MEKKFEGWLMLNWKTKEMKVTKRKPIPSRIGPFQIPIKINIKAIIPEMKEHKVSGEIIVPEQKVTEMVVETI